MVAPVSQLSIPEGIVRLTQAFVDDAALRSWFLDLAGHSAIMRHAALVQMAEQMRADREDPELASAVAALSHPGMFDAVRQALRDRCGV